MYYCCRRAVRLKYERVPIMETLPPVDAVFVAFRLFFYGNLGTESVERKKIKSKLYYDSNVVCAYS